MKAADKEARTERRGPPPISGKRLLLFLLGAIVLVAGIVFYAGMTGGSQHVPLAKPGIGFVTDPAVDAGPPGPPGPR